LESRKETAASKSKEINLFGSVVGLLIAVGLLLYLELNAIAAGLIVSDSRRTTTVISGNGT
jgi:hypothetical protein